MVLEHMLLTTKELEIPHDGGDTFPLALTRQEEDSHGGPRHEHVMIKTINLPWYVDMAMRHHHHGGVNFKRIFGDGDTVRLQDYRATTPTPSACTSGRLFLEAPPP